MRRLLCMLALLPVAVGWASDLRLGRAALPISPKPGTPIGSSYGITTSAGVHDDLYAKALVMDQAGRKAALVACDLISMRPELVKEVRSRVEEVTGLGPDQVIFSATHTHAGPQLHPPFLDLLEDQPRRMGMEYKRRLPDRIAEAVRQAQSDMRPARAWFGLGQERSISFNRRFLMADGSVVMNPGRCNPEALRPVNGIDPAVSVVYFDSPDGEPLATFVNFALHVAIAGGDQVSADFPAVLASVLKKLKGPDMLTVFTMGAAGDINHINVMDRDQLRGRRESERIGTILAGEVLKTFTRLQRVDGLLQSRKVTLRLKPREKLLPGDADRARSTFAGYGKPDGPEFLDVVRAWRTMDLERLHDKPLEADIQVVSIGDQLAWVGLPGEIFVDLGLAVKQGSPFRHTIVSGMSASGTISYVPTRKSFPEGSYEVLSARIAAGGGEAIADGAVRLLRQIHPGAASGVRP